MKRLAFIAALFAAGCGSSYSANSDLPLAPGTSYIIPAVCRPCSSDADCGASSFCVQEDASGLTYCSAPCNSDGTCDADGQSCFTVDDNGDTGCYPSSGSCEMYVSSTTGSDASGNGSGSGTTTSSSTASTTGATGTTADSTSTTGTTASSTTASSTTGTTGTTSTSSTSTSSTSTSSTSTSGTTGSCTPDSWSYDMKSFFQSNCAACHNPTQSWVRSNASSISSRVSSGNMPENATLSQSQKDMVVTWISCGEP